MIIVQSFSKSSVFTISVNIAPNCRNKAVFSNFSAIVWMVPQLTEKW